MLVLTENSFLWQWISTHPWVMPVCTIRISKGRAYQGYTCHIACFSFLDTSWIYIWIYTGLYNFLILFSLPNYSYGNHNFWPVNGKRMKLHIDFITYYFCLLFFSAGNTSQVLPLAGVSESHSPVLDRGIFWVIELPKTCKSICILH